jgi:DNA mismatch repair protein MutS
VQVARLAGVPRQVVARAEEVLLRLERETGSAGRLEDLPLFAAAVAALEPPQPCEVERALRSIDPDELSPREALEAIYRLKALAVRALKDT